MFAWHHMREFPQFQQCGYLCNDLICPLSQCSSQFYLCTTPYLPIPERSTRYGLTGHLLQAERLCTQLDGISVMLLGLTALVFHRQ